jgi:hypothetical protein
MDVNVRLPSAPKSKKKSPEDGGDGETAGAGVNYFDYDEEET